MLNEIWGLLPHSLEKLNILLCYSLLNKTENSSLWSRWPRVTAVRLIWKHLTYVFNFSFCKTYFRTVLAGTSIYILFGRYRKGFTKETLVRGVLKSAKSPWCVQARFSTDSKNTVYDLFVRGKLRSYCYYYQLLFLVLLF